jgi:hypothetical protein
MNDIPDLRSPPPIVQLFRPASEGMVTDAVAWGDGKAEGSQPCLRLLFRLMPAGILYLIIAVSVGGGLTGW